MASAVLRASLLSLSKSLMFKKAYKYSTLHTRVFKIFQINNFHGWDLLKLRFEAGHYFSGELHCTILCV